MGCTRLISFETLPGTSNCCRMGRKKAGKTRFDENAARLRLMKLRGDEGQRSSEMTRAAARSGHSPSLTQPDEPLGYVEAYCISVPVVVPVCVSQLKRMLSQNVGARTTKEQHILL